MIVVCEGCERRFQLDESRIPKTGAKVRCKHCHHRFRVSPPGDAQAEAVDPSARAQAPTPAAAPDPGPVAAAAPGQVSAEDTLFGSSSAEGGGAPIDGDRSLFGSLVGDVAPAPPAPAAGEVSSGGLTQDLQFVTDPAPVADASEDASPAGPSPDDELSSPEALARSSDEALSMSADEALSASSDEALSAPPGDAASTAEATASPGASASGPVAAGPEADASASSAGPEDGGGEDSWEFVDSELSLEAGSDDDLSQQPAPAPAPAAAPASPTPTASEESGAGMQLDPGASHPEVAPPPGLADEMPSLRAVGPGAGPDAAVFEMVEGEDDGMALELEGDASTAAGESSGAHDDAPALAADAPEPGEEAAAAPAPAPEIGTAADWDRLAADGAPAAAAAETALEPDVADDELSAGFDDDDVEEEAEPDWPSANDDLPQSAIAATPRRSHAWVEHMGWALSLVLLLAVAQGTVRIEPVAGDTPPGQVEIAGLVAENVRGRFVENARSGTLFVVSGELRNRGTAARAGGELRLVVIDENGFTFEGRDAPVGLTLAEAQVRETPIGALQQQQSRLARTLGGRTLAPGEGVSFQAILGDLPAGAVRFRLEPAAERTPGQARGPLGEGPGAG
ncbi:MAG TPA: zinc-ribbon domain-containing protein [Myxococcota bacterium]|nr:zinc-ribbon domain-containing protein [Myxococcota bacterium]